MNNKMEKRMEKELMTPPHVRGLDGYRTLAVIGVIFYHLFPASFKGGYLGVVLFFVLSGYMLTDHFLIEYQSTHGFNVFRYIKKRIKSIFPVLLTMFLFTLSYMTIFDRNLLVNAKAAVLSTLTFVNNWWQISSGASYFDRFANPSPYTHLWYLGVLGQLYLLLPILLVTNELLFKKKKNRFFFVVALSFLSAILLGVFYSPEDASRAYYGTDTRAFSFLIGMALAYIWPTSKQHKKLNKKGQVVLHGTSLVTFSMLLGSYFLFSDASLFIYRGGMYLYSFIVAIFLGTLVHRQFKFSKALELPIFRWIGKRSYGIYLFQYPIMIFFEEKVKIGTHPFIYGIIEVVLILLVTEIGYRGLEALRKITTKKEFYVACGVTLSLIFLSGFALATAPKKTIKGNQGDLQKVIEKNEALLKEKKDALKEKETKESTKVSTKESTKESSSASTSTTTSSTTTTSSSEEKVTEAGTPEEQALAQKYGLSVAEVKKAANLSFTAVGDSVLLSAAENIVELFPKAYVDGKISRQAYASTDVIQSLQSQGLLQNKVFIHLGTNGPFTKDQFDELMGALQGHQVYWMNVSAPTVRWQNQVNSDLESFKNGYPNLTIVDWYTPSQGKSNWFYDDGVHPNPDGVVYYVQTIAKALLK